MWLRVPAELKAHSATLQSLWSIIAPLLQHAPSHFFIQTTLLPSTLPPLLLPLLTALHAHTRSTALTSIEATYERIASSAARTQLGLMEDDAQAAWEGLVKERGWELEEGGAWVRPKRAARGEGADGLGLAELSSLTKYIVQLEQ